MVATYATIFERRGRQHAEAFATYPDAVRQEAESLLALAALQSGETVLDVPSASGFLRRFVQVDGVQWLAADPSTLMQALCKAAVPDAVCAPMRQLPFERESIDAVICLAGLHHEPDLLPAFEGVRRVMKPKGRFLIAEVDADSAPAHFLNEFVHRNSSTGHEGLFFDDSYRQTLQAVGFDIEVDRVASYYWLFPSEEALTHGLQLMFGIDRATPQQILSEVKQTLGLDLLSDGSLGMRWSLRHIKALNQDTFKGGPVPAR